MSDINADMKASADYAVKAARERFRQELDYSERSLAKLEQILEEIYWGFSHTTQEQGERGLIFTTATIWGSYLGEYIRLKWGGTWIAKGSDSIVSVNNNEFFPINLVYKKITNHPEYGVEDYVNEVKRVLVPPVIIPQESKPVVEKIIQPEVPTSVIETKKPVEIDKRLIITFAAVGGVLLLILVFIFGYRMIRASDVSAFGLLASATNSDETNTVINFKGTATPSSTDTPYLTVTLIPTYTPNPSNTARPTLTPSLTYTQIITFTPTETQTASPSPTRRSTPTKTPVPPTDVPPPPPTAPPPTNTQPPPVVIQSCEINPSTVPAGINVTITFIVHFSSPGYGFDALVNPDFPGQSGCTGSDNDGDSTAFCDGSSGLLPNLTTINVTLQSSVGDCSVSYSSP